MEGVAEFVQIVYVVLKQIPSDFPHTFAATFPPELNFDAMRRRSARDEYHNSISLEVHRLKILCDADPRQIGYTGIVTQA